MEATAAVPLRPAKEHDVDAQPPADLAGANLPGAVAQDLGVKFGTV
jgi:hypothetical protein